MDWGFEVKLGHITRSCFKYLDAHIHTYVIRHAHTHGNEDFSL